MDHVKTENLRSRLRSHPAGCRLIYEETTASTNDLALTAWRNGCEVPCLFLTGHQTNGRGRFDRVWESRRGASLTASLLFRPACKKESFPMLTEVFALAVCDVLMQACDPMIKWPNDIVIGGRKVCGILTVVTPDLNAAIIGAGINLKRSAYPPELAEKAVSLEEICASVPAAEDLLYEITTAFFDRYRAFLQTEDLSGLKEDYCARMAGPGRRSVITENGKQIAGIAKGIDDKGRLVFLTEDGQMILADSGEVSVKGIYGVL